MKPLARTAAAAIAALAAAALTLPPPAAAHDRDHESLYVPPPGRDAVVQIARLAAAGQWKDALLVGKMVSTPSAVWFEGGSPDDVRREVSRTVRRAAALHTVPVLVTYNIPYRDCSQYSAGGAAGTEEYKAWIDGFAAGLGDRKAIVILEPDSLGIIPYYTPLGSTTMEWCQPTGGSAALAAARFAELNHAVDRLAEHPNVRVYLDGTHSGWLGVGDLTDRLLKAGVQRTQGFYLNVSNYRETSHLLKYGTWTSKCIYLSTNSWWQPEWCASQYYPANPNDFSTWVLSDQAYDQAFADTGLTWEGADARNFVIDTSRNGRGPWTPPADHPPGDPQDWCNPPDRGLGLRPTLRTGQPLVDAYLWVKTPGESDGQCTRWGPGPEDPVRGMVDPPAGAWFPEQALELARLAVPPLRPWYWDD
jgi:endoglucanase